MLCFCLAHILNRRVVRLADVYCFVAFFCLTCARSHPHAGDVALRIGRGRRGENHRGAVPAAAGQCVVLSCCYAPIGRATPVCVGVYALTLSSVTVKQLR